MDQLVAFLFLVAVPVALLVARSPRHGEGLLDLDAVGRDLLSHRDAEQRTIIDASTTLLVWRSRGRSFDVEGRVEQGESPGSSLVLEVEIAGLGPGAESLSHRRGPLPTAMDCWEDPAVRALVDRLEKKRGFNRLVLVDGRVRLARDRGLVHTRAAGFDILETMEIEAEARALAIEVARIRGGVVPRGRPCLSCADGRLQEGEGTAGEDICRRCGGRFLSAEIAQFAIYESMGLTPADVLEAASRTPPWTLADPEHPRPRRCLDCGEAMELALVESVPMDFCPSCGSVWLDKDELLVLSHGRFEEGQTESPRAPGPEEGR